MQVGFRLLDDVRLDQVVELDFPSVPRMGEVIFTEGAPAFSAWPKMAEGAILLVESVEWKFDVYSKSVRPIVVIRSLTS